MPLIWMSFGLKKNQLNLTFLHELGGQNAYRWMDGVLRCAVDTAFTNIGNPSQPTLNQPMNQVHLNVGCALSCSSKLV
jgi:hypothetical protein